jgi:hypothetical protein
LTFHDLRKCESHRKTVRVRPNSYWTVLIRRHFNVGADAAPARAVKTLPHELGHALLHAGKLPRCREVAEVEVESVAYIVCDAVGLESGDYSFAYVARWSHGVVELVKDTPSGRVRSPDSHMAGGW